MGFVGRGEHEQHGVGIRDAKFLFQDSLPRL